MRCGVLPARSGTSGAGVVALYTQAPMPQTLAAPAHSELIIKKSRFIGCVQPMADRASAQAVALAAGSSQAID